MKINFRLFFFLFIFTILFSENLERMDCIKEHGRVERVQYDFEEICSMLQMKPTAVRVSLSRARKTIREQLTKQHNYGVS